MTAKKYGVFHHRRTIPEKILLILWGLLIAFAVLGILPLFCGCWQPRS